MGGTQNQWIFGISPEGIGFVFMWLSLLVGIITALLTKVPPDEVQRLVQNIRMPS